jgi:hypothetical protein
MAACRETTLHTRSLRMSSRPFNMTITRGGCVRDRNMVLGKGSINYDSSHL